jgi:predicted glycosyltransferase involved in capsule biosynthesis
LSTNSRLGIVIPWRPTPTRIKAFEAVLDYYKSRFPESKIYLEDYRSTTFNLSASRNIGCEKAFADGCEYVLVVDADSFVAVDAVHKALDVVKEKGIACFAFEFVVYLSSNDLLDEFAKSGFDFSIADGFGPKMPSHMSSAIVLSKKVFEELNGWDERFIGWGHEDMAFSEAHLGVYESLIGRATGEIIVMAFHRDRDFSKELDNRNIYLDYMKLKEENNYKSKMISRILGNRLNRKG